MSRYSKLRVVPISGFSCGACVFNSSGTRPRVYVVVCTRPEGISCPAGTYMYASTVPGLRDMVAQLNEARKKRYAALCEQRTLKRELKRCVR